MKRIAVMLPALALILGACSSEMDELKAFVKESEKGLPRKIDPLPAVKPFEPFAYEGFDLPDPFKPRKLASKEGGGGGLAPDLNRRKEPLEAFPLEQLKMVGTLSQGKDTYAIVRAEKTLYRVRRGNYMGQTPWPPRSPHSRWRSPRRSRGRSPPPRTPSNPSPSRPSRAARSW